MTDNRKSVLYGKIFGIVLLAGLIAAAYPMPLSATESRATIGGYGELHYNYSRKDGQEASKVLDFHRFVVFLGYSFSEKWSFKAEVELEHNFVKSGQGELELEQAFIDYRGSDLFGFQVGVVLPSVGLINDKHEPPLFLSVERPDYSKYIIPTTWFGNGAAIYGNAGGFDYKLTVMEGLDADGISMSSGIRGARQKGFKADASSLLYNFRVDYTGVLGLLAGGSVSYTRPKTAEGVEIPITIAEAHVKYEANNISAVLELGNISYGEGDLERSFGYYFDLAYNIGSLFKTKTAIYPWFRYSQYNTAAGTALDIGDDAHKVTKWLVGVAVKPRPEIVFKAEFGSMKKGVDKTETKVFNIGAGYMF